MDLMVMSGDIAKVYAASAAVDTWNPNASAAVYGILLSGFILYAAGLFARIGRKPRFRLGGARSFVRSATS